MFRVQGLGGRVQGSGFRGSCIQIGGRPWPTCAGVSTVGHTFYKLRGSGAP